ncbi:MAG: hypothetical protein NTX64_13575 [Elusimicrobia bacterium]|nr:hypothetical protein [Elusimicrobiota bacterium]
MERGDALLRECKELSDEELLRQLDELAAAERAELVRVLARLSELGTRELAQACGYPSVFLFCLKRLRYCESAAWKRSKAAEACSRFSFLLTLLESGELTLTAVALLAPHLTRENCRRLAGEAKGKTTRQIESLVAALAPQAPPKDRVKMVAVQAETAQPAAGAPPETSPPPLEMFSTPEPVEAAPAPIELRAQRTFTCSEEVDQMIRRAQELLWHKYPQGRLEDILREALALLLDKVDPLRGCRRPRPSRRRGQGLGRRAGPRGRYIPKWVRDEVTKRDGDSCAFIGADGRRCGERSGLEYDHIIPFAHGGPSDDPGNIRKVCRAHNQWRARKEFGRLPALN